MTGITIKPRTYKPITRPRLEQLPQVAGMPEERREELLAVSAVLPFRVNEYVVDELIDWDRVPDDPMYQLTFPQAGMLQSDDLARMVDLVRSGDNAALKAAATEIQLSLNPHPAGQVELNMPQLEGDSLRGMQHKYRETCLFFPAQGQTCHAYCTYCFRWAQFVGLEDLKFVEKEAEVLVRYLRAHPEITDVLFTGGDPMIMPTRIFAAYIDPLLEADLPNLRTIRIGTKALGYWPYRFVTDRDADDLMRLFERVQQSGIHLALMAHYSHPVELSTEVAEEAVRRVRNTGAVIRCQAPLIRHVNDDADVWADMWTTQVSLGAVPYYMFVERDTGARNYFEVPLVEAFDIFSGAYNKVSGLARTVRGPSMSATPGKVLMEGVVEVAGEKVMALKFLQGRDPNWVNQLFFARYDEKAGWLDQLKPAFGEREFSFESGMRRLERQRHMAAAAVSAGGHTIERVAAGQ